MKVTSVITLAAATLAVANGFSVSRRDALGGLASIAVAVPTVANAGVPACPPGSKNCISQTWTPPSGTSAADANSQLREAINAYPQEGQEDGKNKVDGGGYTIVTDTPEKLALEYRSSGTGTFAKLFNGGKPFVDDLLIEPDSSGGFEFRSSSRLGDSDFGVNGKRLSYIGGLLKGKGWSGVGL